MNRLRDGSPAAVTLKVAVRAYQLTLRGIIGSHCRFYPHCSAYAIEALDLHGAAKGSLLAAQRLLRCHPWHPGGYDPVPLPPATIAGDGANPHCPPHTPPQGAVAHQKA